MVIWRLLFEVIDLDSYRNQNIVILHNVRQWMVSPHLQESYVDMKLNLQETDYGNFLNEEVVSVAIASF